MFLLVDEDNEITFAEHVSLEAAENTKEAFEDKHPSEIFLIFDTEVDEIAMPSYMVH